MVTFRHAFRIVSISVAINVVSPEFDVGARNLALWAVEGQLVLAVAIKYGAKVGQVCRVVLRIGGDIVEVCRANED